MEDNFEISRISIRYDGLHSADHKIDLGELGKSLEGLNRLLIIVAEFSISCRYVHSIEESQVRIYAKEPRENCFSIDAAIEFFRQIGISEVSAKDLIDTMAAYFLYKTAKFQFQAEKERKEIQKHFDKQKSQKEKLSSLLDKIEKKLTPSVKKLVSPVGITCDEISFIRKEKPFLKIDRIMKDAILNEDVTFEDPTYHTVRITELDIINKTCKIEFITDEMRRIPADILDPIVQLPENIYAIALAKQMTLNVFARAAYKNEALFRFYILSAEIKK